MSADDPKKTDPSEGDNGPALFATIHHQSDERPNGYTADDIAELNRIANRRRRTMSPKHGGLYLAGSGIALVVLLAVGAAWLSPRWVPGQIAKAAEIGDRSQLEQLVDFSGIQTALKTDVQDIMKASYRREITATDDPFTLMFSGIGDSIVEATAESLVDQIVTPLALEKAARGEDVQFSLLGDTRSALPAFRHVGDGVPSFTARGRYLTFSRYEFTLRSIDTDQKFDVQMRRTGPFSWRIDRVRMDPSFLTSLQTEDRQDGATPPETSIPEETFEHDAAPDAGTYKWERTDEDYAASREEDERILALYQRSDCGELVGPERTGCWENEDAFQDQQLNAEYAALRTRLASTEKEHLRQLQRTWIERRDATCANPDFGFEAWAKAACRAGKTAERRIFLQDYRT